MRNGYSRRQLCLMGEIQSLWEQHVYWTRFFIISMAAELPDLEPVTNRLLRNPKDFEKLLLPFYDAGIAGKFGKLFTEHLAIGGDLVTAAKKKDQAAVDNARKRWYENADQIAAFLASINCCWDQNLWRTMLHSHLKMTEEGASLRLRGCCEEDIRVFGQIEKEALSMADYMFCGLHRQFSC